MSSMILLIGIASVILSSLNGVYWPYQPNRMLEWSKSAPDAGNIVRIDGILALLASGCEEEVSLRTGSPAINLQGTSFEFELNEHSIVVNMYSKIPYELRADGGPVTDEASWVANCEFAPVGNGFTYNLISISELTIIED